MRRLVFPVIAAVGLVMVGPSSAFADDPAPTVSVPATPGKKLCKVTDTQLDELSGMVATANGFVVIDDGSNESAHKKVFFLDTKCQVKNRVPYSGAGPRDTEDMILSPDKKTLWIADIGDNDYNKDDGRRGRVAVWKMPLDGSKRPTLYRLQYPEGDFHDAEALLLTGNNTPLIVTKEIDRPAGLYEPASALVAGSEQGVPLKKVGTLTVSATETPANPLGRIGNKTIVGGAIAPGGGKVVLRTYTDALEWDVSGGDVLAALKNKPRTTGLPNETQGEAITYSADGKYFYTVSDMSGNHDAANYILQYTPATTIGTEKKASGSSAGAGKAWYADLTVNNIMYTVGAVGLLGLLLVGAGVLGIVRHRRRLADLPPSVELDSPAGDPETELIGVGGAQQGGVYGGARSGSAAGVYGGPGASGQRGGPVYGSGGPQYGRPQPGGQRVPGGGQRGPGGGQGGAGGGQGGPGGGQGGQGGGQGRPSQVPRPQQPGVYGGQGGSGQQFGQPRGPQQGQRPQRPAGPPPGGGQQPRPQQGQRPPQGSGRPSGTYGQPGGRGDGYADRDGRFDGPSYRR
ncbi:hypothetical protein ODJ79_40395 [Actinoplanes sp. KI2]|uniref:hypothetical protein n=1 Tax=Actinoplanes sp. KI2 TaxID=2983315 RepID=UPI0021D5F892|nr:hypothetical protein [Actinoplanes sp. KI2]MCU7730013.1 hypothetical protein [Actinoplanes sp. KI2]